MNTADVRTDIRTGIRTGIRNAATVILVRDRATRPRVLMGQRGARAAFMPNKFVFPGGAVDPDDADVALTSCISAQCQRNLCEQSNPALTTALQTAAIREVWEETGLIIGAPGAWETPPPPDWVDYAKTGHRPTGEGFRFIFRAITPPGRSRRFDARFFLADAAAIIGDADDFSRASDELSSLQWIALDEVRSFDLPFITEVVLAEVSRLLATAEPMQGVPFFRNDDEQSLFLRLGGKSPLDQQHQ